MLLLTRVIAFKELLIGPFRHVPISNLAPRVNKGNAIVEIDAFDHSREAGIPPWLRLPGLRTSRSPYLNASISPSQYRGPSTPCLHNPSFMSLQPSKFWLKFSRDFTCVKPSGSDRHGSHGAVRLSTLLGPVHPLTLEGLAPRQFR